MFYDKFFGDGLDGVALIHADHLDEDPALEVDLEVEDLAARVGVPRSFRAGGGRGG